MISARSGAASPRVVVIILAVWLAVAIAASATGKVATLEPPAPQMVLAALTLFALFAMRLVSPISRWAVAVDLRIPVALHVGRVVGLQFIYLAGQGLLPRSFAVPAGIGDVAAAGMAATLLIIGPPSTPRLRTAYYIWNVFGLVDILFVVANAAGQATANPASMQAMLVLPLSLLPTFYVPLIIASHVLVFNRLRMLRTSA